LLDGPGQREIPEVRVMVYSGSSGQLLFNNLMFTKFSLVVPAGTHQVELSRNGFRSVSFKINPSQENATYKVALNRVDFFSAKNFLGQVGSAGGHGPGQTRPRHPAAALPVTPWST
jgi:hypothetical protein